MVEISDLVDGDELSRCLLIPAPSDFGFGGLPRFFLLPFVSGIEEVMLGSEPIWDSIDCGGLMFPLTEECLFSFAMGT